MFYRSVAAFLLSFSLSPLTASAAEPGPGGYLRLTDPVGMARLKASTARADYVPLRPTVMPWY